jgi:mannose-6-phosphate isomerase-like protein (cupin superfamily)
VVGRRRLALRGLGPLRETRAVGRGLGGLRFRLGLRLARAERDDRGRHGRAGRELRDGDERAGAFEAQRLVEREAARPGIDDGEDRRDDRQVVLGEHTHSALTETFSVVEGRVGYSLDGAEAVAGPGETLHIPVGARHDWWNAGDGRAHVRFALDSADPAVPMAGRFYAMIEAGFGLAASSRTNAKGMPGPLWLASLAHEYRDVMRLTRPPAAVQAVLFAPLALLARGRGRDVRDPGLHGDRCPARIPAPDDAERDTLLRSYARGATVRPPSTISV